ncbi:protein RALF-like 32 [Canna indica]|uniref:Protein RALF-like 32 n=1 Tax=Canna indica TaxID=4628 RepID=A0AAQ3QFX5_9LILI|nr:protein RALF-like 32 [Canna indica]
MERRSTSITCFLFFFFFFLSVVVCSSVQVASSTTLLTVAAPTTVVVIPGAGAAVFWQSSCNETKGEGGGCRVLEEEKKDVMVGEDVEFQLDSEINRRLLQQHGENITPGALHPDQPVNFGAPKGGSYTGPNHCIYKGDKNCPH